MEDVAVMQNAHALAQRKASEVTDDDFAETFLSHRILGTRSAVSALADDNDGGWWPHWGMGRGMMGGWSGDGGMMGYGPDAMVDRIDGRLAFLKTELKITDAQSAAWDETCHGHPPDQRDSQHDDAGDDEGGSGRFLLQEAIAGTAAVSGNAHAGAPRTGQERSQAVDKLYAVLDDTQKKAADEIVLADDGNGNGKAAE